MKSALEEWLDPSTDNEQAASMPWENKQVAAVTAPTTTKTKSTDDISAAFDDLFNEK